MAISKGEGIILRERLFGETSKVITLVSPQQGKFALVAKGARGPKSRYGSILDRFAHISFVFYERRGEGMAYLSQADLIRAYFGVAADLSRFACASALVELTDRLVTGEEPVPAIFALLRDALGLCETVGLDDLEKLFWFFCYRMLRELGYRPHLDACAVCQKTVEGENLFFSPEKGGLVCRRCANPRGTYQRIAAGTVTMLKQAEQSSLEEVVRAKISAQQVGETANLLRGMLTYQVGVTEPIRSLEFMVKAS